MITSALKVQTISAVQNNITGKWQEENNSFQSNPSLPFNRIDSVIFELPAVAFTSATATVTENRGATTITVELVESNSSAVRVAVAFLPDTSEAGISDIDNYTTQTLSFDSSDTSGSTKSVTVPIHNDNNFEGNELAVFQLQDITNSNIITPEKLELTITDDDAPGIVFNEINADPGDDANNDGFVDPDNDEFIEWVNNSEQDIDISGWVYADGELGSDSRYTFPDSSVIGAGEAFVLFDNSEGIEPSGDYGAADVFSTGEVGLDNSSERLSLYDANGTLIVSATYANNASAESNNLNPDGIGSSYVDHSLLSGGTLSSPGTKVDGTTWGKGRYAISIRGKEGWRLVSTPSQNTSFNDLFSNFWTQGISGSDEASANTNLYQWRESGGEGFSTITDMSNNLEAGRGYIMYMYEDDDFRAAGRQGGFPKLVKTSEDENSSPVSVAVSANDADGSGHIDNEEGYNLLGNPYGIPISVEAIIQALIDVDPSVTSEDVNSNVYVWNDNRTGGSHFEMLESGETIAPFQAFFVRYTTDGVDGTVNLDKRTVAAKMGSNFYKSANDENKKIELKLGTGAQFDNYQVTFRRNGTVGEDRWDGYKLFPLNSNALSLFSTVGKGVKLAKNVLPGIKSLEGDLRIPLGFDLPKPGKYTFSWSGLEEISEKLKLYLVDRETNKKINLRTSAEWSFNTEISTTKEQTRKNQISPRIFGLKPEPSPQFELLIVASTNEDDGDEKPEKMVEISPNYPNPFRSQTTMDLKLKEKMHVKMTIWNIVGQKIATICDEMMASGDHPMTWNITSNIPSGIYICKVEAGGKVLTRKMTLVK